MKLITETTFEVDVLEEATSGNKDLYITGPFAQAEKKNRNGRIYPLSILEREINRYDREMIKTGRALGELEHPQSTEIDPRKASHRIVEMKKVGNDFIGKALVLDTTDGNIVRGLIKGGTNIGVSTRGVGSVTNRGGINEVNEDFRMLAVDVVMNPSGPDCFVNGIMEGVEYILEDNKIVRMDDRQRAFSGTKKLVDENQKLDAIVNFLDTLVKKSKK